MPDRDEIRDELRAEGAQEEHRLRLRGRFRALVGGVVLVMLCGLALLGGYNYMRINASQDADAQRDADIDAAFASRDAKADEQAAALADLIAAQQAYGQPVTAADLAAAIDDITTSDPALKDALKALADKVAALEAEAPVPGPAGPSGETGSPGPTGSPGVPGPSGAPGEPGADGADGADGQTPSVTAALVDGHLIISINGEPFDLGVVTGPQGPQGDVGPQGDQGPAGTALPGDYQCPDSQYLTGFTVAADGSVTLACTALPIGPGSGDSE